MSFIEVVSSLVIVALVSSGILAVGNMVTKTGRDTASYAKLRIYATDKIEKIEDDLDPDMTGVDYLSYRLSFDVELRNERDALQSLVDNIACGANILHLLLEL